MVGTVIIAIDICNLRPCITLWPMLHMDIILKEHITYYVLYSAITVGWRNGRLPRAAAKGDLIKL